MKQFSVVTAVLVVTSLAVSVIADSLKGGPFVLTGAITSGGGRISGDAYILEGAAGQTATDTVTGGTYQLTGGLIGVSVVPGDVTVIIERLEVDQARITWPTDAKGFLLEFAIQLDPEAQWQPVLPAPTGNTFITPINQPLRFYRVRKP